MISVGAIYFSVRQKLQSCVDKQNLESVYNKWTEQTCVYGSVKKKLA